MQLKPQKDQVEIPKELLQVGTHWINPVTTRVLPVDILPWTDSGTAYMQCKGGQLVKVELQATMQVQPAGVREFVQFTYGRECMRCMAPRVNSCSDLKRLSQRCAWAPRTPCTALARLNAEAELGTHVLHSCCAFAGTSGMAAPIGIVAGSALWAETPAEDVYAAHAETPEELAEQLLLAFRVAAAAACLDVSDLTITSVHVLTPAEQKQRLLVYPAVDVADRLKRAVRFAQLGATPQDALAQAELELTAGGGAGASGI